MMRIRGLKGPFFHKIANLNNNLARSVGNFLSISDEDDGGVDPPPTMSNPIFNIGNLGLVFDAAMGWLRNIRSSTATIKQADGTVSDCFVEEIRYSDARRFSPYILSNPVDYQLITLPPGDYIYSAFGIGNVVTSEGTITCSNNRVQLKFTLASNTNFTIEPDAGILFNQLENDNVTGVASEEFVVELDQTSGITFSIRNNTDNSPFTSNINVILSSGGSIWEIDNGDTVATEDLAYKFNNKINAFRWTGDQSLMTHIHFQSNQIIGSIPDLSSNVNLFVFYCYLNQITGSIPDLSLNVNLSAFRCYSNQITGSIPDLSSNVNLSAFRCNSNQITGSIPDLSLNVNLSDFQCHSNQITGYAGGIISATLISFNVSNNALTEAAVNQILIDFDASGMVTGTVNVGGGTNEAPTGAGIVAKDSLVSKGVSVITN